MARAKAKAQVEQKKADSSFSRTGVLYAKTEKPEVVRSETKRGRMLALLREESGASEGQLLKVTGWDVKTLRQALYIVGRLKGHGLERLESGNLRVLAV